MAIKDWKLNYKGINTINYFHSYDGKTNDGELVVYKSSDFLDKQKGNWIVRSQIGIFSKMNIQYFKTKQAALKYAKSYMRKN